MCVYDHEVCVPPILVRLLLILGSSLGNCEDETITSSKIPDGGAIKPETEKTVLRIYPNPVSATSKVVIHAARSEKYTLSIYDMNGRMIKVIGRGELQARRSIVHNLQASSLAKGTYVIKLVTNSEVLIEKILIQ